MSQQAQMEASRSNAGTMKMLERVAAGLRGTLIRLDDMEVVSLSFGGVRNSVNVYHVEP